MRYQILYSKRGNPLTVWRDSEQEARALTERLRKAGYEVTVWLHSEKNVHLTTYPPWGLRRQKDDKRRALKCYTTMKMATP